MIFWQTYGQFMQSEIADRITWAIILVVVFMFSTIFTFSGEK